MKVKAQNIYIGTKISNKFLGINLTKYIQDAHEENHKTWVKGIKEQNKWRDIPCSWIGRLSIVKMSVLSTWSFDAM